MTCCVLSGPLSSAYSHAVCVDLTNFSEHQREINRELCLYLLLVNHDDSSSFDEEHSSIDMDRAYSARAGTVGRELQCTYKVCS